MGQPPRSTSPSRVSSVTVSSPAVPSMRGGSRGGGGGGGAGGWEEEPRLRLAGEGDGVRVSDVALGSVKVGARLAGTALSLDGSVDGARVSATARTTGDMPFEARGELELEDVMRYVPGGPPAGLHAFVGGSGPASGVLKAPGAARAQLRLDELRGGFGDFRVENAAPILLMVEDRRRPPPPPP